MKEADVTRFLAIEVMGWHGSPQEGHLQYWDKDGEVVGYKLPGSAYVDMDEFDPIHLIEHAFMVEDAIAKMDVDTCSRYTYRLMLELNLPKGKFSADFLLAHASPKQRSIAAVRTLATDEQIQAWL